MLNFNSISFATEAIQFVAEKIGNILRTNETNIKKLSKLRQVCRRYGVGVTQIGQDGESADLKFYCRSIEGKAKIELKNPGIMISIEIEEERYK